MNGPLLEALDALVPEPDELGDWDDVLRRSGVRAKARQRRRLPLAAVAVGVALVALLATPAFGLLAGLIERTTVVFGAGRSAPNVVKKQFADLGAGAPRGMAPQAIATEARKVGEFSFGGRRHALWVAPTRGGGYCYLYERANGGCRATAASRSRFPLGVSWALRSKRGERAVARAGEGQVTAPAVRRLELVYRDGTRTEIPFVWVSAPIRAGFFVFDVAPGKVAAKVVGLDAHGKPLAVSAAPPPSPLAVHVGPPTHPSPPVLPPSPRVAPTAPLQHGVGNGAAVTVGRNGVAVFDTSGAARRLGSLGSRVSYSCFRLTREFGIFDVQGGGRDGALAAKVAVDLVSRGPFDGCEISGFYGHHWPDRFGSHSAVELPLTAAGRRFFSDRAAARDLAAFVRSGRVQRLRKEAPAQARADLARAFPQLARSAIHIELGGGRLTFAETSPTGKRFAATVSHGKVVRQNVKPYAFVF